MLRLALTPSLTLTLSLTLTRNIHIDINTWLTLRYVQNLCAAHVTTVCLRCLITLIKLQNDANWCWNVCCCWMISDLTTDNCLFSKFKHTINSDQKINELSLQRFTLLYLKAFKSSLTSHLLSFYNTWVIFFLTVYLVMLNIISIKLITALL